MVKIETLLANKNYRLRSGRLVFAKPFDRLRSKLPKKPSAIRERLKPRLYDYTYLVTASFRKTFDRLLDLLPKKHPLKILDIGCGFKPYEKLFPKDGYVGVDISLNSYANVIADVHSLPFKNNAFDLIIISEVLEHCDNEYKAIKELRRVAKNRALIYLTLPFIFPLHGVPHDFQRLTVYKLRSLFKTDKILTLTPSNNLFAAFFIFINMLIRILFGSAKTLYPFYIINNLMGLAVQAFSRFYFGRGRIAEYWQYALTSFPVGYSMIVRIKK